MLIKDLSEKEQMASLEHQLILHKEKNKDKVFLFISSREKEGVSTVLTNLAKLMSDKKSVKNILLVDANIVNPSLHKIFNLPQSPGFSDLMTGEDNDEQCVQSTSVEGIYLMPSGSKELGHSGIVQEQLSNLIAKIGGRFDYILIDSPPVLSSPFVLNLDRVADSTYLVIQAFNTSWEVVKKTKLYLESNSCSIDGVILNRVRKVIPQWLYNKL